MKIDVTQQIKDLFGEPMVTGKQMCLTCGNVVGTEEPMTLRLVITRSLVAVYRDESMVSGDDKLTRFHLALRIMDEDEPMLQAKEIVLIKDMVAKMYGPVVIGRTWGIIDPKLDEEEEL